VASIQVYPNGAGGATGADLAVLTKAYYSGNVWYVKNATGTDAVSPAGLERTSPLKTLSQAYTNAAAGDTIVFLSGHAESLGAAQTLAKARLALVSEGNTASTRASFLCTGAVAMFDITAAGVLVDNIYFPAATAAPTAKVRTAAAFTRVQNCYFDCGVNDTNRALSFVTGASQGRVTGTTFTVTAAGAAVGIEVINAMSDLEMDSVTFDGSSFGWTGYAFKGTAAVTGIHATRMNRLNGSHVILATGGSGKWYDGVCSTDARLQWTP
jgi:hypothetical protein